MPELPEVETIVRRLRLSLIHQKIHKVQVLTPKILRLPPSIFVQTLTGAIIREIKRKGKLILMDLEPVGTLVIHLKMTGQVLLEPSSTPFDRHTHVIFFFSSSDLQMRYRDIRKFGFFDFIPRLLSEKPLYISQLGPDPFETSPKEFLQIIRSKKKTIKSLLLDQSVISGLGNIYVDESLFQARLHPQTKADVLSRGQINNLFKIIKKILSMAIQMQGSTLKDYRRPDGTSGGFQNYHQVYGRTGHPCPACQSPIVKIRVGSRGTHYCAFCQKKL
ncbi:MAG: DNA-formamidopyrimidine glycosylase [Desulfobacca sp.]|nr:DNA-formamidopyrimidine glycosylase [Desulfobacca sp.]